jgi:chemotaxis protein CheY-P-specific phosphatase CheC
MTETRSQTPGGGEKVELERLVQLAGIGAERAAEAFAQLVGREIRSEAPVVAQSTAAHATLGTPTTATPPPASARSDVAVAEQGAALSEPGLPSPARVWSTGVFFEFEGCLDAIVGILFPAPSSEALVRRIVGIESGELAAPLIESALMEVGNILASHVASGIADAMGQRLLPSIPSLAMVDAEESLAAWVEERVGPDAPRVEVALRDEARELEGRLVLAPTLAF